VREHLSDAFRTDDPSVLLVCLGDGLRPRTASLFCYRTKWRCISVHLGGISTSISAVPLVHLGGISTSISAVPLVRGSLGFHSDETEWAARVERLTVLRARLSEAAHATAACATAGATAAGAAPSQYGKFVAERVLLVLPHAHIGLDDCMQFVGWRAQLGAVVMPCCHWYLGACDCGTPLHQEDDLGVISPHRQVSVWKWAPGDALPPAVPPPDAPPDVLEGETPY
jgi:hypothetical protein